MYIYHPLSSLDAVTIEKPVLCVLVLQALPLRTGGSSFRVTRIEILCGRLAIYSAFELPVGMAASRCSGFIRSPSLARHISATWATWQRWPGEARPAALECQVHLHGQGTIGSSELLRAKRTGAGFLLGEQRQDHCSPNFRELTHQPLIHSLMTFMDSVLTAVELSHCLQ